MRWTYSFDERAIRDLRKLSRQAQSEIIAYLDERIATEEDPRRFGKPLRAALSGLWRYRVRDYRLLCQIKDRELLVFVVTGPSRKCLRLIACEAGTVTTPAVSRGSNQP